MKEEVEYVLVGGKPDQKRIDTLYAVIAVEDGMEGIVSFGDSVESQKPMMFSDPKLAPFFLSYAKDMVEKTNSNVKVELRYFQEVSVQ